MRYHLVLAAMIVSAAALAGVGPAAAALFDGKDCGCDISLNQSTGGDQQDHVSGDRLGAVKPSVSAGVQLAFTLIE
jgi:hypothetical protein